MILYLVPFVLQGLLMFFDEFYFHRKRGLPKWERIGHPLDTLTVLICFWFLLVNEPTDFNLKVAIGLMAFSCLFITKDEFVHTQECSASENWLHSALFVLHPITFLSAALIWLNHMDPNILKFQAFLVFGFMLYQAGYWGIFAKSK